MRRISIAGGCVLMAGLAAGYLSGFANPKIIKTQEPAAEAPIPAADVAKTNPVKPSSEGIAAAKKLYRYHCAMCHGAEGDGKGDLAGDMKLTLKDWRDSKSLAKMTDGELFYIITNGRGKMAGGEGDRTKEEMRWNLVSYVRSFAKKDVAAKR